MKSLSAILLLSASSVVCLAQTFNWNLKNSGPVKANTLTLQGMAYDPVDHLTVVFDTAGLTWEGTLTISGSAETMQWQQVYPKHIPAVRTGESMAWDPVNQQVLMYGGYSGSTALNDTWLYSHANLDWSMLAPANTPTGNTGGNSNVTGRTDYGMVTDTALNEVVIFGGWSGSTSGTNPYILNDTWAWNGNTWTALAATAPTPPAGSPYFSARYNPGLAYDPINQELLLYGGFPGLGNSYVGGNPNLDPGTYALTDAAQSGGGWSYLLSGPEVTGTTVGPGRRAPSLAWANSTSAGGNTEVVMFGGGTATNPTGTGSYVNDTWVWNGTAWTQYTTGAVPPLSRSHQQMVWDSGNNRMVMAFGSGGTVSGGYVNDTWIWDANATSATGWVAASPGNRFGTNFTYDSQYNCTNGAAGSCSWMMAGYNGTARFGDVWGWDGTTWWNAYNQVYNTSVQAGNAQADRWFGNAVYNTTAGSVQTYGGIVASGTNANFIDGLGSGIYSWSGSTRTWSSHTTTTNRQGSYGSGPTIDTVGRSQGMAVAYVPVIGESTGGGSIWFGGGDMTATTVNWTAVNNTLTTPVDFDKNAVVTCSGSECLTTPPGPPARVGAAMVYIGNPGGQNGQGQVMMFGGTCNTHTSAMGKGVPYACTTGVNINGATGGVGDGDFNDVWIGTYTGTAVTSMVAWLQVQPNQAASATHPGPRSWHGMAYDGNGNVWVTGGATNLTDLGYPLNDYLAAAGQIPPPAASAEGLYQDLWYYNVASGIWTQYPVSGGPTAKATLNMVFDAAHGVTPNCNGSGCGGTIPGQLATFGGFWTTGTSGGPTINPTNEVWTLDPASTNTGTININTYTYVGGTVNSPEPSITPVPLNATVTLSGPCQIYNARTMVSSGTSWVSSGTSSRYACTGGAAFAVGAGGNFTSSGYSPGWYSLKYSPVAGYALPAALATSQVNGISAATQTFYLAPGGTTTFSGNYTALGSITVDATDPLGEVTGQWNLVGPGIAVQAGSATPGTDQGSPTTLVIPGHGLTTGDWIVFPTNVGSNAGFTSAGWTGLNGSIDTAGATGNPANAWQVTVIDGNTITVPYNSTGLGDFTETPNMRMVLAQGASPSSSPAPMPYDLGDHTEDFAVQNLALGTYTVYPLTADPNGATPAPISTTVSASNASPTQPIVVSASYTTDGTINQPTVDAGVSAYTLTGPLIAGVPIKLTNTSTYPASAPIGNWTPTFNLATNYSIGTVTDINSNPLTSPYTQNLTASTPITWNATTYQSGTISKPTITDTGSNMPTWSIVCADTGGAGCSANPALVPTMNQSTTYPLPNVPVGNYTFTPGPLLNNAVVYFQASTPATQALVAGGRTGWSVSVNGVGTLNITVPTDGSLSGVTVTGPTIVGNATVYTLPNFNVNGSGVGQITGAPSGNYTITTAAISGYVGVPNPNVQAALAANGSLSWLVVTAPSATISAATKSNSGNFTITGPTINGVVLTVSQATTYPATVAAGTWQVTTSTPNNGFCQVNVTPYGPVNIAAGGSQSWTLDGFRCGTISSVSTDAGVASFSITSQAFSNTEVFSYTNGNTYPLSAPVGTSTTGIGNYTIAGQPLTGYTLNAPSPSALQLLCYNNGSGICPPGVSGAPAISWALTSYASGTVNASATTGIATFNIDCNACTPAQHYTQATTFPVANAPEGIYTISYTFSSGYQLVAGSDQPNPQTLTSIAHSGSGTIGWALQASQSGAPKIAKIGTYNSGQWYLDVSGTGAWAGDPPDVAGTFGMGLPGAIPVTGDWNGDGRQKMGVYYQGFWYLDFKGDGTWDGGVVDKQYNFGWSDPNVIPVVGDWNGDGRTKIGVYYQGFWYLDYDGNGVWDGGINDKAYNIGWPAPGVTPIVGDWSGSGTSKIGIYYYGFWYLDYDGDGVWNPANDKSYNFGWQATGVTPIMGDWNGDKRIKIGIYYYGFWYLDYDGNGVWDGGVADKQYNLGWPDPAVTPVMGDWTGTGKTKIGVFYDGYWYLDFIGNGIWDGGIVDKAYVWGQPGDTPLVGAW
jgi:hypothetical protein